MKLCSTALNKRFTRFPENLYLMYFIFSQSISLDWEVITNLWAQKNNSNSYFNGDYDLIFVSETNLGYDSVNHYYIFY